jgi:hypothetical protein
MRRRRRVREAGRDGDEEQIGGVEETVLAMEITSC